MSFDKKVNNENLASKGILIYDTSTKIATVKMNGKTVKYGLSLKNSVVKNERLVVNREQFWYDIIGSNYLTSSFANDAYYNHLKLAMKNEEKKLVGNMPIEDKSIILLSHKIELMMQDVLKFGDTSSISDDDWVRFCYEFNNSLVLLAPIDKRIHYFRNHLNRAPKTLDDMIQLNKRLPENEKWILLPVKKSIYHMFRTVFSPEGEKNLKFVSADGIFEAVYNKNKILLTEKNDPWNMGTYNYRKPNDYLGHVGQDVIPYDSIFAKYGNVDGVGLPNLDPFNNENIFNQNPSAKQYRDAFVLSWPGKIG